MLSKSVELIADRTCFYPSSKYTFQSESYADGYVLDNDPQLRQAVVVSITRSDYRVSASRFAIGAKHLQIIPEIVCRHVRNKNLQAKELVHQLFISLEDLNTKIYSKNAGVPILTIKSWTRDHGMGGRSRIDWDFSVMDQPIPIYA